MEVLAPEKAGLLAVNDKGYVSDELRDKIFRKLRMKNDSRMCFECSNRNPVWISVTYGVYLCLECSGEHRRKGVHISYVRSVEMDKFYPDQIVQMACGGNFKAWQYFKERGMGKTSDTKRPIDWNSKITLTYKAQIEKETQQICDKLGLPARGAAVDASPKEEAAEEKPEDSTPTAAPEPPAAKAATQAAPAPKPAPKPAAAPTNVIRRAAPAPAATAATAAPAVKAAAPAAPAAPPARSAAQSKAKEIDFDFDFDELEKEVAAKPKAAAPTPEPAPAPAPTPSFSSAPKPAVSAPPAQAKLGDQASKYSKSKAISSEDFFGELDETAEQRMERENRYNKFAASGAISSDAFFGDRPKEEDGSPGGMGEDGNWKGSASKGIDAAKAGISAGKDMLITYLNKVRD